MKIYKKTPVSDCFLNGNSHICIIFWFVGQKSDNLHLPSNCSHVFVINYLLLLFRSICEFSTEEASPFLFKRYQQNYKVYSEQYVTVYFHFKRKRKASSKNWIKGACWRRSSKWLNDPKKYFSANASKGYTWCYIRCKCYGIF